MRESKNNGVLEKELKEKLNWYTLHAFEEKFDEKAVEAILYLLDHTDPLDEDESFMPDEAWEKFQTIVKKRQELLPLPQDKLPQNPFFPREEPEDEKLGKFTKFMQNHEVFVAVAIFVLVLAVRGTIQAGANAIQNNGFFFWLKRDDTGVQMMTSPENLDIGTDDAKRQVYQNKDDLPDWTKEWLEIETEFEMPENYEWQYYEINEFEYRQHIASYYKHKDIEKKIVLGVCMFSNEVLYHEERFIDYSHVQSYEIDQKQMDIYCRTDEAGETFYVICFFANNGQYYIGGQDNLDELKYLVKKYKNCVDKYL